MASHTHSNDEHVAHRSAHDIALDLHDEWHSMTDTNGVAVVKKMIAVLRPESIEFTARFASSWPGDIVEDVFTLLCIQSSEQCGLNDPVKVKGVRLCVQLLGLLFRVGVSPRRLQQLFDLLHPASSKGIPGIHGAAISAIETACKARVHHSGALSSFWSFPGWVRHHRTPHGPGVSPPHHMAAGTGHMALSWQHWPFHREFGMWTMIRVGRFGSGAGEDKSTVARFIAGNGVRLHIWVSHKQLHVSTYEPARNQNDSTGAPASPGSGNFLGVAANRALATAQAMRQSLQGGSSQAPTGHSSSSAPGHHTITADLPSLTEGEWTSVYIHHIRRKGLLGGATNELTVIANGFTVLVSTELPFLKGLSSAPLIVARLGEGLDGELGPIYFWGDGVGLVPTKSLDRLMQTHTGDLPNLIPSTISEGDPEDMLSKVYAMYHPAHYTVCNPTGADCDDPTGLKSPHDRLTCICPDLVGRSSTLVTGYNGVACIAPISIRDSINSIGGLCVLLPLFGNSLGAAIRETARRQASPSSRGVPPNSSSMADMTMATGQGRDAAAAADEDDDDADLVESRSVVVQMLNVLALFLRDHLPNCHQALRLSVFSLLRLEIAPQLLLSAQKPRNAGLLAATPPVIHRQATFDSSAGLRATRYPVYQDPQLVTALLNLAHACAKLAELKVECWKTLVLWTPLYAYTSSDIQLQLLSQVRQVVCAAPDFFQDKIGIPYFVDALQQWYCMISGAGRIASTLNADDLILGRSTPGLVHRLRDIRDRSRSLDSVVTRSGGGAGAAARRRSYMYSDAEVQSGGRDGGPPLGRRISIDNSPALPRRPDTPTASDNKPEEPVADIPILSPTVQQELLREYLRVIGCVMGASVAVLVPAELSGAISPSMLRREGMSPTGADAIRPLRKKDVEALLMLLSDASGQIQPTSVVVGGPPPQDLLRSEVLMLLCGFLDYDASHVASDIPDEMLQTTMMLISGSSVPDAALSESTAGHQPHDARMMFAPASLGALVALDSAAGGDFAGYLLFGMLPAASSSLLISATLRALAYALRANHGEPGRWGDGRSKREGARLRERDKLAATLGSMGLTSKSSFTSDAMAAATVVAGCSGAYWSTDFAQRHGFDILFYVLRDSGLITDMVLDALLEMTLLPDAVDVLINVEVEIAAEQSSVVTPIQHGSGRGLQTEDSLSQEVRAISLRTAMDHVSVRAKNVQPWYKPCTATTPLFTDASIISGAGALKLLLRLLPHMTFPTATRFLNFLHNVTLTNEINRKYIFRQVTGWEWYLYRALLPVFPSVYPAHPEMSAVDMEALLVEPGQAGSTSTAAQEEAEKNEFFMMGETVFTLLMRTSINHSDGWKSFERLFALQPLLQAKDASKSSHLNMTSTNALASIQGQWSLLPARLHPLARHGRRLVTWLVVHTLDDFDARRTRTITSAHIDNLVHITALLDRELTAKAASGTGDASTGRSVSRYISESRSRAGSISSAASSISVAIVSESEPDQVSGAAAVVIDPQAAGGDREGGAAHGHPTISRPSGSFSYDSDAGEFSDDEDKWDRDGMLAAMGIARSAHNSKSASRAVPSGTMQLDVATESPLNASDDTSTEATKGHAASRPAAAPPISRAVTNEPEQDATDDGDPDYRYDGVMAAHLLDLWNKFLTPAPDKAERFLTMAAHSFPTSGNLRHMLINLSLWMLHAYPAWHVVQLQTLTWIQRLVAPLLREVGPKSKRLNIIDDVGVTPARLASGKYVGRTSFSAMDSEEDWEDAAQAGRAGLIAEQWIMVILWHLNSYLRRLQADVVALLNPQPAAGEELAPELPVGVTISFARGMSLERCSAVADMAMVTLTDIFVQCPHAAAAAHMNIARLQAFLEGYQVHHVAIQKAAATARQQASGSPAATEGEDMPSLSSSDLLSPTKLSDWDWLAADVKLTPSSGRTVSSAWVVQPGWSEMLPGAVEVVVSAQQMAFDSIDERFQDIWKSVVHLLRSDGAIFKPLQQDEVATAGASRLIAESSTGATVPPATSAAPPPPGVSAASMAAAEFGRNALRRITSQFKKGLAGFSAVAGAWEAASDVTAVNPTGRGATDTESNLVARWLPPHVAAHIGHIKVITPPWFKDWQVVQQRGVLAFTKTCLQEVAQRYGAHTKREDMIGSARQAHRSVLTAMTLERCAWAGDFSFAKAPMKLSSKEDANRRRMRLVPNMEPVDYMPAAYKPALPSTRSATSQQLPVEQALRPGTETDEKPLDAFGTLPRGFAEALKTAVAARQITARTRDDEDEADDDTTDISSVTLGSEEGGLVAGRVDSRLNEKPEDDAPVERLWRGSSQAAAVVSVADATLAITQSAVQENAQALLAAAAAASDGQSTTLALEHGEREIIAVRAKIVDPERTLSGTFRVTTLHLYFDPAVGDEGVTVDEDELHSKGSAHSLSILRDDDDGFMVVSSASDGSLGDSAARSAAQSGRSTPLAASTTAAAIAPKVGKVVKRLPPPVPQRWSLALLEKMLPRRYLLQPTSLELFFADGVSSFIVFPANKVNDVFEAIWAQKPLRLLSQVKSLQPAKHVKASRMRDKWRRREISNFDYLMHLNTLAGRSFNDITQYPVFPWVIANYASATLDLGDPANYRDLSKPIGALDPERLALFRERYSALKDGDLPPFMYGSHYSSAGVVLFYLIRVEPFTSLAVELQGGKFDCPDRLFFSVAECWHGVTHSMSDVKELIPEWYTTPEIFVNMQQLPLGRLQDDAGVVNDVVLPPWAKTSQEFVWINRAALESEYVSQHLHEWIDLIFGCKQRGHAALDADNLFYYLTYEDAVNLDAIKDPIIRQSTEAQIAHFGQTPTQLFKKSHPSRLPKDQCPQPLFAFDSRLPTTGPATSIGTSKSAPSRTVVQLLPRTSTSSHPQATLSRHTGLSELGHGQLEDSSKISADIPTITLAMFDSGGMIPVSDVTKGPSAGAGASSLDLPAAAEAEEAVSARLIALPASPQDPPVLTDHGIALYTASLHPSISAVQSALVPRAALVAAPLASASAANQALALSRPVILSSKLALVPRDKQISFLSAIPGRIVTVYGDATCSLHRYTSTMTPDGIPYDFRLDKPKQMPYPNQAICSQQQPQCKLPISSDFAGDPGPSFMVDAPPLLLNGSSPWVSPARCHACIFPTDLSVSKTGTSTESYIFSCGYGDGGVRWQSLSNRGKADYWCPRLRHRMTDVTCIVAGDDLRTLVTGHADGIVNVWHACRNSQQDFEFVARLAATPWSVHSLGHYRGSVSTSAMTLVFGEQTDLILVLMCCLVGQQSPITCVAASAALDLVVAGSLDGTLGLFSMKEAKPLRYVRPHDVGVIKRTPQPSLTTVTAISICKTGTVCVNWQTMPARVPSSAEPCLFSRLAIIHLNGTVVATAEPSRADAVVTALASSSDGTAIIVGMSDGWIQVRHGLTLQCGGIFAAHEEYRTPDHPPSPVAVQVTSMTVQAEKGAVTGFKATLGSAFARLSKSRDRASSEGDKSDSSHAPSGTSTSNSSALPPTVLPGLTPFGIPGPGVDVHAATAVTYLLCIEDDRVLLIGCGDGRLCIVTDPAGAQKSLTNALQQGLFSLV